VTRGTAPTGSRKRGAFARTPAPGLIDRDAQTLPVPVGDGTPVRVARQRRRRLLRRHGDAVAMMVGCVCAVAGAALLGTPTPESAYLSGDRVHMGAMTLAQVGPRVPAGTLLYGGDASYALSEPGDGTARASAAWMEGGAMRTGLCNLRTERVRLIDECTFDVGSGELSSVDVLDIGSDSVWQRTYADGRQVDITVPTDGAAVPVPFPIGR
jgi:hypothetical protein